MATLAEKGDKESVIKEGTLAKQGSSKQGQSGGLWKKRYFVLLGSTLTFYESEKKEGTVRVFQIHDTTIECKDSGKGKRSPFTIHGPDYALRLGASSNEERQQWVQAITLAREKDPCADRFIQGNRRSGKASSIMSAEKKAASAALKTKKGREYVKEHIPPDSPAYLILNAYLSWMYAALGPVAGQKLETDTLQVLVKALILDKHGVLDTVLMRSALPHVLRACESIIEFKEARQRFHIEELRLQIAAACDISLEVLAAHVKENTMTKARHSFQFVLDPENLTQLFFSDDYIQQRDDLVEAIQDGFFDVDRECDTYFLENPGARITPWWKQAQQARGSNALGAAGASGSSNNNSASAAAGSSKDT